MLEQTTNMLKASQLYGFNAAAVASAAPLSLTPVDSAYGVGSDSIFTLWDLSLISVGDLIIVALFTVDTVISTAPAPSGWVSLGSAVYNTGAAYYGVGFFAKIATAGDISGFSISVASGMYQVVGVAAVYNPDRAITETLTGTDFDGQYTTGNPTAQVKNATAVSTPNVVIAAYYSDAAISPTTFTGATPDLTLDPFSGFFIVKFVAFNSSPADITVDMDDEGGENVLYSCILYFV